MGTLCRFADTPEEKARKLAKKASLPPGKFPSLDLLQSIAGQYQLSMDGMHPGLPAGFTAFSAAGIPDANGGHFIMSFLRAAFLQQHSSLSVCITGAQNLHHMADFHHICNESAVCKHLHSAAGLSARSHDTCSSMLYSDSDQWKLMLHALCAVRPSDSSQCSCPTP